jgi:thiamine kinase-like enzyme
MQKVFPFLHEALPMWKDLHDDEIEFFAFKSITNRVYKVTAKRDDISPNPVILRYSYCKDGVVDKEKEVKIFNKMSEARLGPKCYGVSGELRLEEFIPSRTLRAHEYKEKIMRRKLAKTLALTNNLEIPDIEKVPLFESTFKDPVFYKHFDDKCEQQDIYTPEEFKTIQDVKALSSEEEKEFIREILPSDEIVFSHNDLLGGNVLITEDREDVIFIDYEYGSYNFRGYDIGNMYKEATFDYSYDQPPYFQVVESNFPNDDELRDFLRYYIVFTDLSDFDLNEKAGELINDDEAMRKHLEKHYHPEELQRREDLLYRNTMIGVMLSHYYWIIWAVKMVKTVQVKFDYLEFARVKYETYKQLKSKILKL